LTQPGTNVTTTAALAQIPAWQRAKMEADIARWQQMSASERQAICDHFKSFFDLKDYEKKEALKTLSEQERQQMEKKLGEFGKLTKDQRAECVLAFQKFAGMGLVERQQFLKNAERWQQMSPGQRQTWRDLVHQAPELAPLPVGFSVPETGAN